MANRRYYSIRTGKNPNAAHFGLDTLKRLLRHTYLSFFYDKGYFQEAFGYHCVDRGFVPGTLGYDIEAEIQRRLRKPLPFEPSKLNIEEYSEDDVFDIIELLFDCVSKPTKGDYHAYNDCGMHYYEFDRETGRREYRREVNSFLVDYQAGYELTEEGEILALADPGLQSLLDADLPGYDPENVEKRVQAAILKFRRRGSTTEDRHDAVRDLADVLEFLRPKAAKYFLTKKDDDALYTIANQFAIRHHDGRQKGDYNVAIWYSWIFYVYLATIHASVRAIKEMEGKES